MNVKIKSSLVLIDFDFVAEVLHLILHLFPSLSPTPSSVDEIRVDRKFDHSIIKREMK